MMSRKHEMKEQTSDEFDDESNGSKFDLGQEVWKWQKKVQSIRPNEKFSWFRHDRSIPISHLAPPLSPSAPLFPFWKWYSQNLITWSPDSFSPPVLTWSTITSHTRLRGVLFGGTVQTPNSSTHRSTYHITYRVIHLLNTLCSASIDRS